MWNRRNSTESTAALSAQQARVIVALVRVATVTDAVNGALVARFDNIDSFAS